MGLLAQQKGITARGMSTGQGTAKAAQIKNPIRQQELKDQLETKPSILLLTFTTISSLFFKRKI